MAVVIEAAVRRHCGLQRILARVTEGRVADVVREAQGFGQILVEPERARDTAADLRDLDAVGQPDAIMLAVGRDEHLRLVAQAAEGDRMDDAVAVALKIVGSEEHTSELLSLMRISYAVFCLKKHILHP